MADIERSRRAVVNHIAKLAGNDAPTAAKQVLELRHGGSIGRLVQVLGKNTDAPFGPVSSSPSPTATARAENAADLAEAMWKHLKNLSQESPQTPGSLIEALESEHGGMLGRLVAALGGLPDSSGGEESSLIRLLRTDVAAAQAATEVSPESHAELYEIILLSLTTPHVMEFLKEGRSALRHDDPVPTKIKAAQDQPDEESNPRKRLALLLADRARYVIPLLVGPEAQLHDDHIAKEPELAAVERVHDPHGARGRGK